VRVAVSRLSPTSQAEVAQLLALLAATPTRVVLAGVRSPWPQASADEIKGFLESWRRSRLALLQSGYHALHDLMLGAWYADPANWTALGYTGPPAIAAPAAAGSANGGAAS